MLFRSNDDWPTASQASTSCGQRWSSRTDPPAPGAPGGTSATSGARARLGFSVPSMKPRPKKRTRRDGLALRGFSRNRGDGVEIEAKQRGHGAGADRHRLLHGLAADAQKPCGVGDREGAGGGERGIFTE